MIGHPAPSKGEFEEVILVEVRIEEMFGSDQSRPKDYERAVVVERKVKESNEDHSQKWRERSAQK
jgi:hypothetical protein